MNKKIIVTGSEGLIGREVCKSLKKKGFSVIKCSRSLGHDLTNEKFVKEWFKKNKSNHLINLFAINDGISNKNNLSENFLNISLKSLDKYLKINVTSLFSVCREYARNNKRGNIINFSSIYGIVSPDPKIYENNRNKNIGYTVSKSGVIHLTKYLAVHLAPNIRVNCIVPGGIISNQSRDFVKKYSKKTLLNRMMKVKEINGIIKFLCSDESSYCTGAQFVLDGGYTVKN